MIYFLRRFTFDAVVSIACIALPLVADSLLKPLKWVVKSVDDFVILASKKVSDLGDAITSLLTRVIRNIKGNFLIPANLQSFAIAGIDDFSGFVNVVFKGSDDEIVEEVLEESVVKMTTKEITLTANRLGFEKIGDKVHGQAMFRKKADI